MNLSGSLQFIVDRSIIKSYSICHRTLTYLTEIEMIPIPGILISKSPSKSISWLQVRVTSTAPWRIDSTWQPSLTPHVSPVECSQAMKYNFSTSSTPLILHHPDTHQFHGRISSSSQCDSQPICCIYQMGQVWCNCGNFNAIDPHSPQSKATSGPWISVNYFYHWHIQVSATVYFVCSIKLANIGRKVIVHSRGISRATFDENSVNCWGKLEWGLIIRFIGSIWSWSDLPISGELWGRGGKPMFLVRVIIWVQEWTIP